MPLTDRRGNDVERMLVSRHHTEKAAYQAAKDAERNALRGRSGRSSGWQRVEYKVIRLETHWKSWAVVAVTQADRPKKVPVSSSSSDSGSSGGGGGE